MSNFIPRYVIVLFYSWTTMSVLTSLSSVSAQADWTDSAFASLRLWRQGGYWYFSDFSECDSYVEEGNVRVSLTCYQSHACLLKDTGGSLENVTLLPPLMELLDSCTSATRAKAGKNPRSITTVDIRVRNVLLPWNYFCGLDAVTVMSFSESLNDSRGLGFNEGCVDEDCCLCSLNHLILSDNNLRLISDSLFCGLPYLKILELRSNGISEIDTWAFVTSSRLEMLDLSLNKLRDLPDFLFFPLRNSLRYLDLSMNELNASVFISLRHLHRLESLSLSINNISTLNDDYIRGLEGLRSLRLHGNKITRLWEEFRLFRRLEVLVMSGNLLNTMSRSSFQTMSNLSKLDLSNNRLASISDYTFLRNRNLKELDVSNNQFSRVPDMNYLSNLAVLKMAGNLLSGLNSNDTYSICRAKNLNHLDLSNNRIRNVHFGAFSCLSNLSSLYLEGNDLKSIAELKNVAVDTLSIRDNKITTLSFKDISPNVSNLFVDGNLINEFNYDCIASVNGRRPSILKSLELTKNNISVFTISDNRDTSSCLFGTNSLPKINLNSNAVKSVCKIIMKLKRNYTMPPVTLRYNEIRCSCELNFMKPFRNIIVTPPSSSKPVCYPDMSEPDVRNGLEVFRNLGLLDNFTCPIPRWNEGFPCHCNINPDYYQYCGLSCPNGCKCFISNQFDLHFINCSSSNLTFIPGMEHGLESVIVNFSGNQLTFLNGSMMSSYINATQLVLSNNSLQEIDETSFLWFHLLEVLLVDHNQLRVLRSSILEPLKGLKVLDLSYNQLIQIDDGSFRELGFLQTLALDNNRLTSMPISNLEGLKSLVGQGISLHQNPWSCDCEFAASFGDWLQNNSNLVKDPDSIVCMRPLLTFNASYCLPASGPLELGVDNLKM